jgi:hypothetical protein
MGREPNLSDHQAMSGQRHRIRRQVLEIVLRDQGAAWSLQSEISRIQRESLEAIIDRCCTEVGDPDRLHRIESLEVDLGHIHPDHLEHELVERLGPRLKEALVARIRAEDEATSLSRAAPETTSRLELLAFFAKTGSLPWWADTSRPRLLDEAVRLLLQRAARPLVALVRDLARDLRQLRRLVLHCEDEQLSALFAALVASAPRGLAERPAELRGLWTAHRAIGVLPSSFRRAVWVAVLRAASIEESAGADAVGFWRGTLAHAALELGVTYTVLVTQLHEAWELDRADRPDALGAIVQSLYREVRGEAVAGDSALRESIDDVAGGADEMEAIVDRLARLGIEPRALLTELLRVLEDREASPLAEVFREARSLLRGVIENHGGATSAHESAPAADSDAPAANSDAPAANSDAPSDVGAGEVEAILDRLERVGILPRALSRELRAMARRLPARGRIPLLRVLEELEAAMPVSLPPDVTEETQRLLREAIEEQRDRDAPAAGTAEQTAATAEQTAATAEQTAATAEQTAATAEQTAATAEQTAATAEQTAATAEQTAATAEEAARIAEEMESLLDRLERSRLPLGALFAELRAMARPVAAHRPGAARGSAPRPNVPGHLPGAVLEALKYLEQRIMEHGLSAPEAASSVMRFLHSVIASRRLPPRALERALEELERAAAASPPAQALGEATRLLRRTMSVETAESTAESPPLDLAYGDSEDVYVENAGLVILWPFLGHLFERLELMADKRFKDPAAQHRAVGLLQHLATEDPCPPEYQLVLAKVLCGMKVDEVFDFGPPVTEAEAEEGAGMLTAVIANAPILKNMSIDGFRGSFLLRKGVLGARDGAWLLRVERATHDVVLDRFPWAVSWVKLPWMEAPLSVEW